MKKILRNSDIISMIHRFIFISFCALFILVGLFGSYGFSETAPSVQPASPVPPENEEETYRVNPVDPIQPKEIYNYDPKGRRDPFLSIIELTKQKIKGRKKLSMSPIENYDLTDFKLIGTVFNGKGYYASILLPDGKAYTVREGMKLGLYGGKITEIISDQLTVREETFDFRGNKIEKDIVLKLRKEEEE